MSDRVKRNERRKAERPEEILEAARQELAENGIAGCTFANIAARAGISRTTIYLYFKTKQDVFEAVARNMVEQTIDAADAVIDAYEGPVELLFERIVEMLYQRLVEGYAAVILKALVAEGQDHPEIVRFYHDEILSKGSAVFKKLLDLGVERGEFAPFARELDPRILVSPAIFAALWTLVFQPVSKLDVASFRRDHIQVMMKGLKQPPEN
ncbi:MAG: TetR/AcrR family transcriptional regulator [Pseudomonadota bacterium]